MSNRTVLDIAIDFDSFYKTYSNGIKKIESTNKNDASENESLNLLYRYYTLMAYLSQKSVISSSGQWSIIHYQKTMGDLFAVYSLLSQGLNYQSMVILRSLTETTISTKYISLDSEKRGPLYENHKFIDLYFLASHSEKDKYESNFNLHKENYNIKEDKGYSLGWYHKEMQNVIRTNDVYRGRQPSIKLMAEIAGLEDLYKQVYSLGSSFTHGASNLNTFLTSVPKYENDKATLISGITLKLITEVVTAILSVGNDDKNLYANFHNFFLSKSLDLDT